MMRGRTTALVITMFIAAVVVVAVTVEAVRTDRLQLNSGGIADGIPDSFYGSSFLPEAILDNVGWVIAAEWFGSSSPPYLRAVMPYAAAATPAMTRRPGGQHDDDPRYTSDARGSQCALHRRHPRSLTT